MIGGRNYLVMVCLRRREKEEDCKQRRTYIDTPYTLRGGGFGEWAITEISNFAAPIFGNSHNYQNAHIIIAQLPNPSSTFSFSKLILLESLNIIIL